MASNHNPDKLMIFAFQRAAARRTLMDIDGYTGIPEFVAAVGECDGQINKFLQYKGWTRESFFNKYDLYLRCKQIEE